LLCFSASFLKKDDKFKLIAVETAKMKPSYANKDGVGYLRLSGSAGGPSQYVEIYTFKDGKRTEYFTALLVAGEIDGCSLNGRDISVGAGQAYLAKLPQFKEITAFFKDIDEK
jgi:hypothetical protein